MIQNSERTDFLAAEKQVTEGKNLLRACLFNLVVISHDPTRVAHCNNLIQIITAKYPCKIIFIRQDPLSQSETATISSNVQIAGSEAGKVLCDTLIIEVATNQFHKIPFLILPHLAPDLPTYFITGQDPSRQPELFHEAEGFATRLIFDPDHIDPYCAFAERIDALSKKIRTPLIDLNWSRIKAWRDALAKVFQHPDALKQLTRSKMIQISYVERPDHVINSCESEAMYLQAWIASRLQWHFLSTEKKDVCISLAYEYDHAPLTVSLVPKDTEILPPGAIFSVEVMTRDDYHFLVSHEHDGKLVKVHASNPEKCEMPYTIFLANFQNGPSLVNEILYQPQGTHYFDMLHYLQKCKI